MHTHTDEETQNYMLMGATTHGVKMVLWFHHIGRLPLLSALSEWTFQTSALIAIVSHREEREYALEGKDKADVMQINIFKVY